LERHSDEAAADPFLTALCYFNALRELARIIHQELADVVYLFEISYDFAVEFQNPRIQRPHPP
jgi:hypothetical protein